MSRYCAMIVAALLTACGGGGGGDDGGSPDPVPPPPPPAATAFTVSGRITVSSGIAVDSDVNDIKAPYTANDTGGAAQLLPNAVILGGYVNVAGTGVEGRSKTIGDPYDIYKFSGTAGQVASLRLRCVHPQSICGY